MVVLTDFYIFSLGRDVDSMGIGKTSIMVKGRVVRFNDYFTLDIDRKAFDIGLVKESRKRLRGMPSDVQMYGRDSSGAGGWHFIFITQKKFTAKAKSYFRRVFHDDPLRVKIDNRRKRWKGTIHNYESGVLFEFKETNKAGEWGRIDFRKVKHDSFIER